jgi:hypothetical protein
MDHLLEGERPDNYERGTMRGLRSLCSEKLPPFLLYQKMGKKRR